MFLIWTVAAVTMTLGCEPYSTFTPKRLAVLHQHDANAANADEAVTFLVGAFDSVPAAHALQTLHRASVLRPTTREDFGSMHPVTQLLGEGVVLPSSRAKSPPWGDIYPSLRMSVLEEVEEEDEDIVKSEISPSVRIEVEMNSRHPAWSCIRVEGPIVAWSLSEELPTATGAVATQRRWARHAGNGDASQVWKFWVKFAREMSPNSNWTRGRCTPEKVRRQGKSRMDWQYTSHRLSARPTGTRHADFDSLTIACIDSQKSGTLEGKEVPSYLRTLCPAFHPNTRDDLRSTALPIGRQF